MNRKNNNTKSELLKAFDQSETKQITDACRICGVALGTYYFHFYKDAEFRREVMEKQRAHLAEKIATIN
jgi:hypothetical protein